MKMLEIVRANLKALDDQRSAALAELDQIPAAAETEARSLTADEEARAATLIGTVKDIDAKITEAEAREAELVAISDRQDATRNRPGLQVVKPVHEAAPTDVVRMAPSEARDAAMRVLERSNGFVSDANKARLERMFVRSDRDFRGDYVARRTLLTENEHYRSAYAKAMMGHATLWTSEEQRAVAAFQDFERAMSIGTDASGGFGVPVLIDPSIILTSGAAANPIMRIARVVNITNDEWKGVSSTGSSWSWDAEASAVSDDSPTLAQPSVPVYTARGFVPFSIEVNMDYPAFASEMAMILDQGYMDLTVQAFTTGSGSSQPTGIFTALDANTNVEVVVTTDGAFGAVDIDKVWAALPERYRSRAQWVMNVDVENEIRAFGSGTATSRFTVDQTREGITLLNGKPVNTTDYAPTFIGTTGAANILVLGDFSNFLIAQRAGMTTELVPHLFDVTNNRPTLQRGLLAYARVGSDSVNDLGFRLLQNQ
jgi:HK97 family phage major capsid protein